MGLSAVESTCHFNCPADQTAGVTSTRYLEVDHLGTTRLITDENGAVVATLDGEPYGLEFESADANSAWWTDFSSETRRFTGHERDFFNYGTDTQAPFQDYMRARAYPLATARFASEDPIFSGSEQTWHWNEYPYVGSNPVNFLDPTGESPDLVDFLLWLDKVLDKVDYIGKARCIRTINKCARNVQKCVNSNTDYQHIGESDDATEKYYRYGISDPLFKVCFEQDLDCQDALECARDFGPDMEQRLIGIMGL